VTSEVGSQLNPQAKFHPSDGGVVVQKIMGCFSRQTGISNQISQLYNYSTPQLYQTMVFRGELIIFVKKETLPDILII
jgi:hypothetical protein